MKKIAFIIPPTVQLLDLAGPVQVFTEARSSGLEISIEFYAYKNDPVSASGLQFVKVANFSDAQLKEGDFVFVSGLDQRYVSTTSFRKEKAFFDWLKKCSERNIIVCSSCNGAFALGEAGLLNGVDCTTHWRRVRELQLQFPKTKVLSNVLYVKNSHVYTSAGSTAGVDLALSIVEDLAGTLLAQRVARALVFYSRNNGKEKQDNIYLHFRNHLNNKIHHVQNYVIENLSGETSIAYLARIADMSPRNLTRLFKQTTGITINEYLTKIRLETARTLLKNPENNLSFVASRCGFKTARQLQRILK